MDGTHGPLRSGEIAASDDLDDSVAILVIFLGYSEFQQSMAQELARRWDVDPKADTRRFGTLLDGLTDEELLKLGRSSPEAVMHERLVQDARRRHRYGHVAVVASDQQTGNERQKDSCELASPFHRYIRLTNPGWLLGVSTVTPRGIMLDEPGPFLDEVRAVMRREVVKPYSGDDAWVYCSKASGYPPLRDRLVDAVAEVVPADWPLLTASLRLGVPEPAYQVYERPRRRPELARTLVRALHADARGVIEQIGRAAAQDGDDLVCRLAAAALSNGPAGRAAVLDELRQRLAADPSP